MRQRIRIIVQAIIDGAWEALRKLAEFEKGVRLVERCPKVRSLFLKPPWGDDEN